MNFYAGRRRVKKTRTWIAAAATAAMCSGAAFAEPEGVEIAEVKAAFSDVRQDVADAIVNRGYVIDHTSLVGDMLKRTREVVGSDKTIFNDAELVQFCSAVLSRKMMEADPTNIAFCPWTIFYYERADATGTVHVGFRELDETGSAESRAAKKRINNLLSEIVDEVTGQ